MGYAATTGKSARGEVGRLKEVRCYLQNPRKIFLIVDYEGFEFTGCLLFDDAVACEQMANFLKNVADFSSKILEVSSPAFD